MKTHIVIILISLSQVTFGLDIKSILNLDGLNLNSIDLESAIKNNSLITESPKVSSAVIYMLYGSAKRNSEAKEAQLIKYNEKLIDDEIIHKSKPFLLESFISHTNQLSRSMALSTIAFAFPKDPEIATWIVDQYFFNSANTDIKASIIGAMRIGGYDTPECKIVLKDALLGTSSRLVINAATCIKENSDIHRDLLPDLIAALLSLDSRKEIYEEFGSDRNLRVSFLMLTQAIGKYGEESHQYISMLKILSSKTQQPSLRMLIQRIQ